MAQDTPADQMVADVQHDDGSSDAHGPDAHVRVAHSPSQERYEAYVGDDWVGYLDYVPDAAADRVVITHTVIADRFAHHGYAAALVRHVLDDIATSGRSVVPMCSYVQHFIALHPAYAPMAAPVSR